MPVTRNRTWSFTKADSQIAETIDARSWIGCKDEKLPGLTQLVSEARKAGWASATMNAPNLEHLVALAGWHAVPSRKGGPASDTLRPVRVDEARPNSLSAHYGRGTQPLHTDGAHHQHPPEFVVLASDAESSVPTRLWKPDRHKLAPRDWGDLRYGLFAVRSGETAFLAAVLEGARWRFDPGCMHPSDPRARRISRTIAELSGDAVDHAWTKPGTVLVIHNHSVLHGRRDAVSEPERELRRVAFSTSKGVS